MLDSKIKLIMNTLLQSEIFFFISSIGFIFLWILIAILLFYLIKIAKIFSRITSKLEREIDNIGEVAKKTIKGLKESAILSFFFKEKKKKNKK